MPEYNRVGDMRFSVKVTGQVRAVVTLPRQIEYAAKQSVIQVTQEAQGVVIKSIKRRFHVRGRWFEPGNRFGIHVRYSRNRSDLSANLETYADWLEEHETGGDKTADKHDGHLTVPQVGAARPTIGSIVPAKFKARRILPNVGRIGGGLGRSTARPSRGKGKRAPQIKANAFFINRAGTAIFERTDDRHLVLFYTLTKKSHIKQQSTVFVPTSLTVRLRFGDLFNENLRKAMATAK